jgi:hypothetical protein
MPIEFRHLAAAAMPAVFAIVFQTMVGAIVCDVRATTP